MTGSEAIKPQNKICLTEILREQKFVLFVNLNNLNFFFNYLSFSVGIKITYDGIAIGGSL